MNKQIKINPDNPDYINPIRFTENDVAEDHKWTYIQREMNFEKDLKLKGKYCYHPFNTITIDKFGDVYLCICQAWMPISVGKIWEFDSLDDCVKNKKARSLQSSIIDGSYRYCDNNSCSLIKNKKDLKYRIKHKPDTVLWINFAIDPSCNLTCPSCRNNFIFINSGEEYNLKIKIVEQFIKLVENHTGYLRFTISNDGDPFASLIYRKFLTDVTIKNKKTEIEIVTNGQLLKDHWLKLEKIHKNISKVKISFDAGSEEIYKITRRGGNWNKLLESTQFLIDWKKQNNSKIIVETAFVVQTTNYKDIPSYINTVRNLGVDVITFQRIEDWGTFKNGTFKDHKVWDENHPEYHEFLNIINDPTLKDISNIVWNNLSNLVK